MPEFKYDAALVHGYWPSQKDNGVFEQGFRGRFATRMTGLYFPCSSINNLVTVNGQVWGPNYPPVAKLMIRDWIFTYAVPPQRIFPQPPDIALAKAITTRDEVDLFLELAAKNGWKNLLDIAWDKHFLTIKDYYPLDSLNVNVDFKSVEQIVQEIGSSRDKQELATFKRSRYEMAFLAYELGHDITINMGLDPVLNRMAHRNRGKKGAGFQMRIDQFDL